jgi:two-component sensor histidine kinase
MSMTGPDAAPRVSDALPDCARDCVLRSEADHRVANHLAMLASYVRLKGGEFGYAAPPPSRAAVQFFAQSIEAQIRAVGRLHRLLMSGQADAPVGLAEVLHEVCAPFVAGLDPHVALVEDCADDCVIWPNEILPVSQIVSEAVINAAKYAYPGGRAGVILVRAQHNPDGSIRIEVIDEGIGLPAGFDPEHDGAFGVQLMRSLSRGLGAQMELQTPLDGLRVSCTLPSRTAWSEAPG